MATSLKRLTEIIDEGNTFTDELREKVEGRLDRERARYKRSAYSSDERREIIQELERVLKIDTARKKGLDIKEQL